MLIIRTIIIVATSTWLSSVASAGTFPPGFIDPWPVLNAAEGEIGADRLDCVTVSGEAYGGALGQQKQVETRGDWPLVTLKNYSRTMNWRDHTMSETFDRPPGKNPASWRYGLGWRSGMPVQRAASQSFFVNGKIGWSRDGADGAAVAALPDDSEVWQLDLWMNPVGFLKAARMPGANPVATWRWEMGEMGSDGPTGALEKVTVVSITVLGKYRVNATINARNLIQRVQTLVANPVLGDMNYEYEFNDDAYAELKGGGKVPTYWHHHQGWDDNSSRLSFSSGHSAFGGDTQVVSDVCPASPIPAAVKSTSFAEKVEPHRLASGVWLLGGSSHNSVAIEFKDYVAVVEAPLNEQRSLAVITEIGRLVPNKPIRFVINTHQHFDAIGGLRTYIHTGATIITHWANYEFYNRDLINYAKRTVAPDMLSLWPPTELAEGYNYETVRENYVLSDGVREVRMFYISPLKHVEGMLAVYLPREKILIQSDIYDNYESRPMPVGLDARVLLNNVSKLKLDVKTLVPLHGHPIPWAEFLRAVDAVSLPNKSQ